jgi:hypothetical protein
MNYDALLKLTSKSKKKTLFVSLLIILTGGMFFIPVFTGDNKIVYWVVGILFIALGVFMLYKSISDLNKIKAGELPLLRAIATKDSGFIVWMYVQEIKSSVEGVKVGTTNNVMIFDRNHKSESILLGRKENPHDLLNYLSTCFPDAKIGYTPEYIQMFKKKKS